MNPPTIAYDMIQIELHDNEVHLSFWSGHNELAEIKHLFLPNETFRCITEGTLKLPTD